MTDDEIKRLGALLVALWRIAVLIALIVIGWQLAELRRATWYAADKGTDAEQSLRKISGDVEQIRKTTESVERNTRR